MKANGVEPVENERDPHHDQGAFVGLDHDVRDTIQTTIWPRSWPQERVPPGVDMGPAMLSKVP